MPPVPQRLKSGEPRYSAHYSVPRNRPYNIAQATTPLSNPSSVSETPLVSPIEQPPSIIIIGIQFSLFFPTVALVVRSACVEAKNKRWSSIRHNRLIGQATCCSSNSSLVVGHDKTPSNPSSFRIPLTLTCLITLTSPFL